MRAATLLATLGTVALLTAMRSGPQEPLVDGSRMRPGVDTFVIAGSSGDSLGFATQATTRAGAGAQARWVQVYRWHDRNGSVSQDSLEMDAATLRPLVEVRGTPAGNVSVTYDGARVRSVATRPSGEVLRADTTFSGPVYSSAAMDPIARSLPLRQGLATTVDFYYPFPAPFGVRRVRLTVTGSEVVNSGRRAGVDCWVVALELPGGKTRFWLAKDTGEIAQFASTEGASVYWARRPGAPAAR